MYYGYVIIVVLNPRKAESIDLAKREKQGIAHIEQLKAVVDKEFLWSV